jgi:hypothetical protein
MGLVWRIFKEEIFPLHHNDRYLSAELVEEIYILFVNETNWDRYSSVGIATGYRVNGPGIESR